MFLYFSSLFCSPWYSPLKTKYVNTTTPLFRPLFFMKNQCCNILRWNVTILTMRIDTKIHSQSTLVEICFHISCLRKPYLQEQSFPANLACRYDACGPFVDLRSKQECNYKYDDWIYENRLRLCTKIAGMLLENGQIVYINMAMSYWERYLPRVLFSKRSHNMVV